MTAPNSCSPGSEGARLSKWLADYSQDLMEEGDFDQEAAELDRAAQWISERLNALAQTQQEPLRFMPALERTLKIMKRAHDGGGDRLMSIWLEDLQAVEEAVAALTDTSTLGNSK